MIYLQFLTTVVAFIGVFLNIKMLLNCFKNQTKTKPLIISQFVYQVAILALNTMEVWTDKDTEFYRLFRHLMSTFLSTVLAFNCVAILLSKFFSIFSSRSTVVFFVSVGVIGFGIIEFCTSVVDSKPVHVQLRFYFRTTKVLSLLYVHCNDYPGLWSSYASGIEFCLKG